MPTAFMLVPPSREPPARLGLLPSHGKWFEDSWLFRPDRPLDTDELAKFSTKVELQSPISESRRVDFMLLNTNMVVSNRVVDVIEALEPGRHQFIELQIENEPLALKRRNMTFHYVNCCLYLDCIDKEASRLRNIFADNPKLDPMYGEHHTHDLCSLPGWRPTAHVWHDKRWLATRTFVSAEMKERIDAINAGPIGYRPVHLV